MILTKNIVQVTEVSSFIRKIGKYTTLNHETQSFRYRLNKVEMPQQVTDLQERNESNINTSLVVHSIGKILLSL